MRNKKQMLLSIIIGIAIMMQYACSDDKSGGSYNGPLKLLTFYPDSGYFSSKIIIEAENLGTDVSQLSVYFNKSKGFISQAAGNVLMVYAPRLPGDECVITVVKGNESFEFDKIFRYIPRFVVENVCGKEGSGDNFGGDLSSTTFRPWRLAATCCDPEGNLYVCMNNPGAPGDGGLVLISEKNNLSKKLTGVPVNDVLYHEETGKVYGADLFRNIIYEIDPSNDWKVKNKYLKQATPPAIQVDYDRIATIAYCSANGYFYGHTITNQLFRFKLEDMVCEFVNKEDFHQGTRYLLCMKFDPTEPTKLYTSYGTTCVMTVQDVSKPDVAEEIYAGHLNQNGSLDGTREDCLLNGNNQISIVADKSGQKVMHFSNSGANTIRQIDMITGMVTTSVGRVGIIGNQSGTPEEATFNYPTGIALNPEGDLYIADHGSGCIRKLSLR